MNVRKTEAFVADVERYVLNAGWEVADRYLGAVEGTCRLIELQPKLGPRGGFVHPRLRDWRFFVVFPPFKRHILFYETTETGIIFRRAMHGHRDLPRRLLEPPENP